MMSILEPKDELIVDIVKKYELNARFCIVIETDVKPYIIMPADFIQFMAKIDTKVEFDNYLLQPRRRAF